MFGNSTLYKVQKERGYNAKNTACNPVNNSLNVQVKDTTRNRQKQTIFAYLYKNIATATMVSDATGIPQKSICRYKRDFEKNGVLWELYKRPCKNTGFLAWYLTTNTELKKNIETSNTDEL